MNWDLWFGNLAAYTVQTLLTLGTGALLFELVRGVPARVRLACAQALLLLCLALPALAPWKAPAKDSIAATTTLEGVAATPARARGTGPFPWKQALIAVALGGAVLRLLWLAVGCYRLSRYADASEPWADAVELDRIMRRAGVAADVGVSPEVGSPVTFGFLAPVILVPPSFAALEPEARAAVLDHELLHIRRRDWAFVLAEEIARALLWFQPMAWWLLSLVHLAREQVVDDAVVRRTGRRREYLDALIAVARGRLAADLAPAPLFMKRRHLASRVDWLIQESTMPMRRAVLWMAVFAAVVSSAGWYSAHAFPFQAPGMVDTPGVKADPGSLRLLHAAAPVYPAKAADKGIEGDVTLEVRVDAQGEVSDARVVSGPDPLRAAALQAVLGWHYAPAGAPAVTTAVVHFTLTEAVKKARERSLAIAGSMESVPLPASANSTLNQINLALPAGLKETVESRLGLQVGDQLDGAALIRLGKTLREIDEHLTYNVRGNQDAAVLTVSLGGPAAGTVPRVLLSSEARRSFPSGVSGGVAAGVGGGVAGGVGAKADEMQVRVGGNMQQAKLIHQVAPVYPPLAKEAHIQGTVRLNVTIAPDGNVRSVELISGHPLLADAAMEAVKQWQYQQTFLNGNPVAVIASVDLNFTLSE